MANKPKEPTALKPQWPEGLEHGKFYRVLCDDKGRDGGTWLQVMFAEDGDAHVSMQDWEDIREDGTKPSSHPTMRVRTWPGGGRNSRTLQALRWLAIAIALDNEENGVSHE